MLAVSGAYAPSVAYGGPVESTHLCLKEMQQCGATVRVLTTDANGANRLPFGSRIVDGIKVTYFRTMPLNRYGVSPGLWRAILGEVRENDVIHTHGTMQASTSVALWAAALARKPIVVSPHGSLMAWGRKRKAFRRRLYWLVDGFPARRALFHVTSETEAQDLRGFGVDRLCVVPNGVDVERYSTPSAIDIRQRLGLAPGLPVVAWLGRFDPVKNVETVIAATQGLGVELVLAGDWTSSYGQQMRRLAGTRQDVHFVGYVQGELKVALLQQSSVFVSASHMESYGIAIAEALAAGCPVAASTGTPWESLDRHGAGLWVEPKSAALRDAVRRILASGATMRAAARDLAARHSWRARARDLLAEYQKLVEEYLGA